MMKIKILYLILLLNGRHGFISDYKVVMSKLQESCPFTSFCEEKATMHFPENNMNLRPCCGSCSCKPGCEKHDNCCYGKTDVWKKCRSPTINSKARTANFWMLNSCLNNTYTQDYNKSNICIFNETDYKSFAPVVSRSSGDIFVNLECAQCNEIYDIIPWKLAINCPMGQDVHSIDVIRLLNNEITDIGECFLSYIPPKHISLQSQECSNDVITECNVTGRVSEWEPLWNYCPIINAPFSTKGSVYGNIFCFLCNEGYRFPIPLSCTNAVRKNYTKIAFSAILHNVNQMELDRESAKTPPAACRSSEAMVRSVKTACRRVVCSLGKTRIGNKCGFYSKEWIGGPFMSVFKLSPVDKKINISILSDIRSDFKNDTKARWLKRDAMKSWNVEILYRPSSNKDYIEYFVARIILSFKTMNPEIIWNLLNRTLKETWTLHVKHTTVSLNVEFNRYEKYIEIDRNFFQELDVQIDQEYGFMNSYSAFNDSKERYVLGLYPNVPYVPMTKIQYINELFLNDLIELRPNEFLWKRKRELILMATNETLYEAEFRPIKDGNVLVCLKRFDKNKGLSSFNHFRLSAFIIPSCVWFTKHYVLQVI